MSETTPAQRWYVRVTDNQFLIVGVFTTITWPEGTRYWEWRSDWHETDECQFAWARDDLETHFTETQPAMLRRDQHPAGSTSLPRTIERMELQLPALAQVTLAREIATSAHLGQFDKLGGPYIEHPQRVASSFDPIVAWVEHCASWLHDVIEDTGRTADDLLDAGVSPEVVEVVQLVTRRAETSDTYYSKIREHPRALAVKLADIADNVAPWRTHALDPETRERLAQKYYEARTALGEETA